MSIKIIGVSHKTAPIDIREKFYLSQLQQDLFLSELKSKPEIVETFIISTCNRTEIYINTIDTEFDLTELIKLILSIKKLPFDNELLRYFYQHEEEKALNHLLRVTAGLESLVIGEKQILGQVKKAFEKARERGVLAKEFNILANITIRAGKKAQTETAISFGGSSVSWAAVMMAEQVLGELRNRSILIIGAGKMSELAVGQISSKGFKHLYLMNRTPCNAEVLVNKYGGEVVAFCDIKELLTKVDICICSADAPHYVVEFEAIEKILPERTNKKLVLIDISMPRNIDPKISTLPDVELFHIDDLNKPIEENIKKRYAAVIDVEKILRAKLSEYFEKIEKIKELASADGY